MGGHATGFGAGSLTIPVHENFGAQLDLAGGLTTHGRALKGAAVRLFWRDPDRGLIGPTFTRAGLGARFFNRVGLEAEYYRPAWTLALRGGYQNGSYDHTGYGAADFRWYATDDLMVEAAFRAVGDDRFGRLGVQWQPVPEKLPAGLVLFGSAGVGDEGYTHVLAGLRFYFGPSKSLKRRHREDDPENDVVDDVLTVTNQYDENEEGGVGTTGAGAGGNGGGGGNGE